MISTGNGGAAEGEDRDKITGNWNFSIIETNMLEK